MHGKKIHGKKICSSGRIFVRPIEIKVHVLFVIDSTGKRRRSTVALGPFGRRRIRAVAVLRRTVAVAAQTQVDRHRGQLSLHATGAAFVQRRRWPRPNIAEEPVGTFRIRVRHIAIRAKIAQRLFLLAVDRWLSSGFLREFLLLV